MSVERWQLPSGRIATIDLNQPAEAVEDARRLLREFGDAELINKEAPDAGKSVEGENQKPTKDSVESKATRHARAAKAPRGTIAADRRIVVEDVPARDATVHEHAVVEAAPPRDVVRAEDELAHLPLRIRRTTSGLRARVWRSGDGTWWRQGGHVWIRETSGERAFCITLYKGANEGDLRFMLELIEAARAGKGFGSVWHPVTAAWADDLTFSTGSSSRPYADPYTHTDREADVHPCDDDTCAKLWHADADDHELDGGGKSFAEDMGGYEISVQRAQEPDAPWRVRVNVGWFDGMPADVASFVNDLQWMQGECERANRERAA
ncbi:hypothetical protein [Microbacterium esteraromaticum]|uniref:hypothetical protein n=1 Tax=Microbacterium esteraromaticum TaxID=57043 RepID=UPI001C95996D|nr:hypothetical protein [Microbacterium esteraromaticum]MBY6061604.1 hypothetical protein [Microbacterium esteraromaticum]